MRFSKIIVRCLAWAIHQTGRCLALPWLRRWSCPEHRTGPWKPGVSVVIPERSRPDLLEECLQSLEIALEGVDEPWQVLVSVSDASPDLYKHLRARFPWVEWAFSSVPLGFSRALGNVLDTIRYEHTYLLNNDMRLDRDALTHVLALRSEDVFAIGSQIFMADREARRVETGLTACCQFGAGTELFDVLPGDDPRTKEHLYAGGGASLFRTTPLLTYARQSRTYEPAYWEDVEWGVRAWREGWRVLFCPASHAIHRHRATASRLFTPATLEAIFQRNRRWFDLRNGDMLRSGDLVPWPFVRSSLAEVLRWIGFAISTEMAHWRARGLDLPDHWFLLRHDIRMCFGRAARLGRPRLLCVTPFALMPIDHGGARRTHELLKGLAEHFDVALVSDEGGCYPVAPAAAFPFLCSLWTVRGRADENLGEDRAARDRRHAWDGLREALEAARVQFRPDIVLVEHAELTQLVDMKRGSEQWWLDLHDVEDVRDDTSPEAEALRCMQACYEHVVATTEEQLSRLSHASKHLVSNGSSLDPSDYVPSRTEGCDVLFVGNLRYSPNVVGLRKFIRQAWPEIVRRVPGARLLLAGVDKHAAGVLSGNDPSITGLGVQGDLDRLYARASLTINPQEGILGTSVKVAESLCAGRVCVATREAAQGWGDWPGLVVVERVADMAPVVVELLLNAGRRGALEQPDVMRMASLSWSHQVQSLVSLWQGAGSKPDVGESEEHYC